MFNYTVIDEDGNNIGVVSLNNPEMPLTLEKVIDTERPMLKYMVTKRERPYGEHNET